MSGLGRCLKMHDIEKMRLGRTGLQVSRVGFGALPIQRCDMKDAIRILSMAYGGGVNFFDTARAYSDSEEKLGRALSHVRDRIVIATKTGASDAKGVVDDLEKSLRSLRTDYVDIYQMHCAAEFPGAGAGNHDAFVAIAEARQQGKVRFLGLTAHKLSVAVAAAETGLFDTVQYPVSILSTESELDLVRVCSENDVGLIAMKALCGGLVKDVRAAFAYLWSLKKVLPIWGIQHEGELEAFLSMAADPPALDDALISEIEKERHDLAGDFCRGCGYCMPCPRDIPIPTAARIYYLMRRAPSSSFTTSEWRKRMSNVERCSGCGDCRKRCPYNLDPPSIMKRMYTDYLSFL